MSAHTPPGAWIGSISGSIAPRPEFSIDRLQMERAALLRACREVQAWAVIAGDAPLDAGRVRTLMAVALCEAGEQT